MTTTRTQDAAPAPATASPEAPVPAADTGLQNSAFGVIAGDGFLARIGAGLHLSEEDLTSGEINLEDVRQPLPGMTLKRATYSLSNQELTLTSELAIPHVADGEFTLKSNSEGRTSIDGSLNRQIEIPALGNPDITVTMTEEGQIDGSVTVEGANLAPEIAGLSAVGSGELTIVSGRMSGSGSVTLTYADLGNGTINFSFGEDGSFSGDGNIHITPPFIEEITAEVSVDEEQNFKAEATLAATELTTPIPGFTVDGGNITIGYNNGRPYGSFDAVSADYNGLANLVVESAAIGEDGKFAGSGSLALTVPMLNEATGTVAVQGGNVSGSLTIGADQFPEGLPIDSGTITATLSEAGQVGLTGSLNVNLGPAGTGHLEASYNEAGDFSIGATIDLTVPGLEGASVTLGYVNGDVTGEATLPINEGIIPGLSGDVTVRFAEGRWAGETELGFEADGGKLSGTINVTVAQNEDDELELGGSGSLTAQLMPRLQGTLTAEILPEGGMNVGGVIEVTEPLELFPEERLDQELFNHSQNIPLWAILVAVIRIRAGVRAGIGPGVFRNIRVEGSYTIGQDEADPTFDISGEMFIPAFVEGYVAFGAGLGLDVLLGSLTGGIEGVATAGIYGAISVVPTLSYADGDWTIDGIATMAAGARLKLGLNAWAEIEALWVTVWSEEWALAEHVMPVGPDLGLRAQMSYTFGQPEAPEITMTTDDIDTDALVSDAMPKDGPAPSGAREALQNHAEWQGQLREQREAAIPPDLQAQAGESETPPAAPGGGPSGNSGGPPSGGAQATGAGANQDPGTTPTPGNEQARSGAVDAAASPDTSVQRSVPESEVLNANDVRYPGPITLAMLDQPAAPMPRTRSQEQEDINAAQSAVELASRESSDSDALDNYFARIKTRFGLSSLGYEGDFQTGFKVVGKINPTFQLSPNEPIRGTGIPSDQSNRHITNIIHTPGQLGTQNRTVGAKMEATILGPDHPQGGPPRSQAWMSQVYPMAGEDISANMGYIRGHLLNDNLGGSGNEENLFPITSAANRAHEAAIESYVKRWVNDDKFWVYYKVEIQGNPTEEAFGAKKIVNATMKAEAHVLDTELEKVSSLSRSVTIASTFEGTPIEVNHMDRTEEANAREAHSEEHGRDIDNVDVQLSTRHQTQDPLILNGHKRNYLTRKIGTSAASLAAFRSNIKSKVAGIGDARIDVLIKAWRQNKNEITGLEGNEPGYFRSVIRNWAAIVRALR